MLWSSPASVWMALIAAGSSATLRRCCSARGQRDERGRQQPAMVAAGEGWEARNRATAEGGSEQQAQRRGLPQADFCSRVRRLQCTTINFQL